MKVTCLTHTAQIKTLIEQCGKLKIDSTECLKHLTLDFAVNAVSCHALFWAKLSNAIVSYTEWQPLKPKQILKNIIACWPEAHILETNAILKLLSFSEELYRENSVENFLSSQNLTNALCSINHEDLIRAYQRQLPNDAKVLIGELIKSAKSKLDLFTFNLDRAEIKPFIKIVGKENELAFDEKVSRKPYLNLNKEKIYSEGRYALFNLYKQSKGIKDFYLTSSFLVPKNSNTQLITESYAINEAWLNLKATIPSDLHVAIAPLGVVANFKSSHY